jgi:hypothetical protein
VPFFLEELIHTLFTNSTYLRYEGFDRSGRQEPPFADGGQFEDLRPFAAPEQILPITPKRRSQSYQRGQGRKVFSGFEALNVASAYAHFFGKFFLSPAPLRSQRSNVLSELGSVRTRFGLARRHTQSFRKPSRSNTRLDIVPHFCSIFR